jgi:hypothetical protein
MHSQCQLYNEGDRPSQWKSDSKSSARIISEDFDKVKAGPENRHDKGCPKTSLSVEEGSDGFIFPGFKNKCPKSILGRTMLAQAYRDIHVLAYNL